MNNVRQVIVSPSVWAWLKQSSLRFSDFDRHRAPGIIVCNLIDPTADCVGQHLASIKRSQELRDDRDIFHARIKPQFVVVVTMRIEHNAQGSQARVFIEKV